MHSKTWARTRGAVKWNTGRNSRSTVAVVQMVPGRLNGVAVPVHVGRRTIVLQTSIYRPDGKLAAMMIQTQMVLPSGAAASSNQGSGEA